MKLCILTLSIFAITACSSSSTSSKPSEEYPPPKVMSEKQAIKATQNPVFKPAKPMKCTYDSDCTVQNSCAGQKCKITGSECRFRSDCPNPRGTCINKICEFN